VPFQSIDTFAACYGQALTLLPMGDPVSTLPPDSNNTAWAAAEILLSPNGKFLLASNRGQSTPMSEGSIVVFALDADDTKPLTVVGTTPSGGVNPRSMALSASGAFLAVTNQGAADGTGGLVTIFTFDQATGALSAKPVASYACKTPQTVVWWEKRQGETVAVSALTQASICPAAPAR
jgi:6-phosphogluconolactonase (cycloisomerase 2 family)